MCSGRVCRVCRLVRCAQMCTVVSLFLVLFSFSLVFSIVHLPQTRIGPLQLFCFELHTYGFVPRAFVLTCHRCSYLEYNQSLTLYHTFITSFKPYHLSAHLSHFYHLFSHLSIDPRCGQSKGTLLCTECECSRVCTSMATFPLFSLQCVELLCEIAPELLRLLVHTAAATTATATVRVRCWCGEVSERRAACCILRCDVSASCDELLGD